MKIMKIKEVNTGILTMNKQWIEDSHLNVERCRMESWHEDGLDRFEYLDIIGLYETCWMVFDFDDYTEHDKGHYGYPNDE
ncbi:hypothetical protein LCGC14_3075060 [marine sediment metagenome]|uniref:Uncharacterized protein n=1 Tax=marine sediment metagenome TaxID=412755 RepID=A0A0F8X3F6_9ZZZZ